MLLTNAQSFLDKKGAIAPKKEFTHKFVEFVGSLIIASTFLESKTENPLCFNCGNHVTSVIAHTEQIVWQCNVCEEEGIISNWHGTLWDMSGKNGMSLS